MAWDRLYCGFLFTTVENKNDAGAGLKEPSVNIFAEKFYILRVGIDSHGKS